MLIISAAETLAHVTEAQHDPVLSSILDRSRAVMGEENLAALFIIQPGDRAGDLARYRQRSFECWEYIDDWGGWFETVFVISDYGFGDVVLIPDQPTTDQHLLSTCMI